MHALRITVGQRVTTANGNWNDVLSELKDNDSNLVSRKNVFQL